MLHYKFPRRLRWNCETFAQNQNANAIRFATLYNFRFDSNAPPADDHCKHRVFKTGSPISVTVQAPAQSRRHADADRYSDCYGNADSHTSLRVQHRRNSDTYSYANCDGTPYSHAQAESHHKGTPNAASASVSPEREVALVIRIDVSVGLRCSRRR